jgi:PAS domain S-box-containing protein
MAKPGQGELAGFVVAGVSPRLAFNDDYKGFMDLLAGHVATAVANARAYEEEKKRAEALAELDRAKTVFFANVSHEFRTPLTLILGPLEDALAETPEPRQRERLELLHRNALRLQKLVNTLLDFSRIEAGRIRASYEPTDLAALTRELASVFRSAVEKAGMRLIVHCPPLGEPVYVDRDMYEKVVLNLLSNAFKFTLEGEIEVALRDAGAVVELSVRDTGTGIAEDQLPHVFERFHRVEGARARTHEGTGIGLALVQELVKRHGGTVGVRSSRGQGSTFTVVLPKGKGHLPIDRLGTGCALVSTALTASHYLEEALRWLPGEAACSQPVAPHVPQPSPGEAGDGQRHRVTGADRPRVVWADDNADMRDYVRRLLSERYNTEAVADGEAALAAARRAPPDLVLADVMMPGLDGFGLLRELRADERTRAVPVVLVSARAGEESRVEGLQAGADDYLVKPFSARELLARVEAHLQLGRVRRDAARRERSLRAEADAARARLEGVLSSISDQFIVLDRDWRYVYVNDQVLATTGMARQELLGKTPWEVFPDLAGTAFECEARRAVAEGRPVQFEYHHPARGRWFEYHLSPSADGLTILVTETTARRQAEEALKDADRRKDEFLATLAHELRNPLAPLLNSLNILQMTRGDGPSAERVHEMMERQLNHMVRLVDDLMEVSRISRGKIELRTEPVELAAVIRSAVETSRPLIESARHQLAIALPPEPLTLEADPVRLAQVFANLLNNAAKYTEEGGQIWLAARVAGDGRGSPAEVVVTVRDTGVGIAAEMLPRVFEMFTQVDRSLGRAQGGLGIGLALVRSLVQLHGGSVEVKSDGPARGSEFTVRLPLLSRPRSPSSGRGVRPPAALPSQRILVVDDNRDAADTLGMLLKFLGADVRAVNDGPAALDALRAFRPAVVLMDLGMPGMDGYEVARQVRREAEFRDVTLIALTGWGQEEDRRRTLEAGFDHHLVKPVDLDALRGLLDALASRKSVDSAPA